MLITDRYKRTSNIIDYQKSALDAIQKGIFYSELGW